MKRALYFCLMALLLAWVGRAQQSATPAKPAASKPGANPKKKLLDADLQGFELSDDKNVHTTVGGTRGEHPLAKLLAPRVARIYGPSALFQWSVENPNNGKEGYVFTVVDEDEARIVREQVTAPSYKLPAGFSKLRPGESYYWRVQVLPYTMLGEGQDFMMVSAEEGKQIEKELAGIPAGDPYETGFARARIFVAHHLWFDSIGAYTELIEKFPDRAQLYEDRGAIYSSIEATRELAEKDRAKAAALQSGSAH
jgi:Domain of Unknown Function (DUF928)